MLGVGMTLQGHGTGEAADMGHVRKMQSPILLDTGSKTRNPPRRSAARVRAGLTAMQVRRRGGHRCGVDSHPVNAETGRTLRSDRPVEGMTGIEPAPSVWKTEALPLSYIPVLRI